MTHALICCCFCALGKSIVRHSAGSGCLCTGLTAPCTADRFAELVRLAWRVSVTVAGTRLVSTHAHALVTVQCASSALRRIRCLCVRIDGQLRAGLQQSKHVRSRGGGQVLLIWCGNPLVASIQHGENTGQISCKCSFFCSADEIFRWTVPSSAESDARPCPAVLWSWQGWSSHEVGR